MNYQVNKLIFAMTIPDPIRLGVSQPEATVFRFFCTKTTG